MERLLDPKNDWMFKQLFGQDKNKDLLIEFLNDSFADVRPKIKDVNFLKVETDSEVAELRQSIVDVLCECEDGSKVIIEMQKATDTSFIKRAVAYASRVYLSQRRKQYNADDKKTSGYEGMHPVIFFAVMDKVLFPKKEQYISHHRVQDILTHECDIKEMSFSFLELSKMNKHYEQLESNLEKWIYFFKNAENISPERLEKIFEEDTIFSKAYMALQRAAYTSEQLIEYERYDMKEAEIISRINDAENKGREEGRAEGIEKGRAEERAKAEEEKAELKRQTAKNLLSMGLSVEQAAQAIGLTIEGVKNL